MLISHIASDMGLPASSLELALAESRRRIKHLHLQKSGGGHRTIHIAPQAAKLVQYWLIANVLRDIPLGPAAAAYFRGASILRNAAKHRYGNYLVRIDLENFFESILSSDFEAALERDIERPFVRELRQALRDPEFTAYLFPVQRRPGVSACGVGYPISPYVANLVMRRIDEQIHQWLVGREHEFGRFTYSRYADDLVISVSNGGRGKDIVDGVTRIIEGSASPRLRVNMRKTKFGNVKAGSAQVTGLRITPDRRITLHREYKDHVRLLVSLAARGTLRPDDRPALRGHLNYCRSVDPAFYGRLYTKYYVAVSEILA